MTTELQEKIEELESKLKSVNKESGDRRMEIKTLREDLENARSESVMLQKQVFFAERVLDKVNLKVNTREADLSRLGLNDDGEVTGEVNFEPPVPSPPLQRASSETRTITLEDVKRMTPQEVTENWETIRKITI